MKGFTRRHLLRGAGLALALPWLESLAPRQARGQGTPLAPPRVRFVPIYFPLGTASFWKPTGTGEGDAWKLSPILEPLAALKKSVTVLGHVDQTCYGAPGVTPGNGLLTGSYLTGARCSTSFTLPTRNGISIDQRLAQLPALQAPLPSMQLGLANVDSYCDGAPCAYSRSISWKDETTPLFKLIDPQLVFDNIVTAGHVEPTTIAKRDARKSVLDYVDRNGSAIQKRLGKTDRVRMDQFLTSVRDLEQRIALTGPSAACKPGTRPTLSVKVELQSMVPASYDRSVHADLMIDLIVMALACDVTRVVSFMLDDARADSMYTLATRHFSATGSTPTGTTTKANPIALANSGDTDDAWATLGFWYVSKLAALAGKMAAIPDGANASLLDNSIVWFGSGMQGEWRATDLPQLYVGSGGGKLRAGWSIDFQANGGKSQSLSNVYLTFLRAVYGAQDASFGDSTGVVTQIVA